MIRLCIKMMLFVTVARWMYAEVTHIAPSAKPTIDALLEKAQIPVHSEWAGFDLRTKIASVMPAASDIVDSLDVTLPIRHSAAMLKKATFEIQREHSAQFDKF